MSVSTCVNWTSKKALLLLAPAQGVVRRSSYVTHILKLSLPLPIVLTNTICFSVSTAWLHVVWCNFSFCTCQRMRRWSRNHFSFWCFKVVQFNSLTGALRRWGVHSLKRRGDCKLSFLFEHTVLMTHKGCHVCDADNPLSGVPFQDLQTKDGWNDHGMIHFGSR